MRIKVSPANVPALVAALTKLEKEIQDAGHDTFLNGLFIAIGGGTQEAGTLYLKSITADEKLMAQSLMTTLQEPHGVTHICKPHR